MFSKTYSVTRGAQGGQSVTDGKPYDYLNESFVSTSTRRKIALDWIPNDNIGQKVMFEIAAPKGTRALGLRSISYYPHEHEVLLDKGTTLSIFEVRKDISGKTILRCVVKKTKKRVTDGKKIVTDGKKPEIDWENLEKRADGAVNVNGYWTMPDSPVAKLLKKGAVIGDPGGCWGPDGEHHLDSFCLILPRED